VVLAMAAAVTVGALVPAGPAGAAVPTVEVIPAGSPDDTVISVDGSAVVADAEGEISGHPNFGSLAGVPLNRPVVAGAATPSGRGYWLAATDGGVFSFGDAAFHGSLGHLVLNRPVVGMAATPSGRGYWLVASDGGVFAFGDAAFHGSLGHLVLNRPIVAMAATPSGRGYWLAARDGGVFAFGDAGFHGSASDLGYDVEGIVATPSGDGYWLVGRNGSVRGFGAAASAQAPVPPGQQVASAAGEGTNLQVATAQPPPPPPLALVPAWKIPLFDALARCESNGNWAINTRNGFFGGLQFTASSWRLVGGSGLPHQHSREEQIYRAHLLQERQGWGAWPACSRRLGIR
jgi:uncharacterized membrane protein YgdD (TMEM256/DUF423 family)